MELDEPHLLSAALVEGCAQLGRPVVCLSRWSASQFTRYSKRFCPLRCRQYGEQWLMETQQIRLFGLVPRPAHASTRKPNVLGPCLDRRRFFEEARVV